MAQQADVFGDPELIQVFSTPVESEAMVVKGLLESAGVDALVTGLDAPQEVLPGVGGLVIRVRPEEAEKARQLIQEQLAAGSLVEGEIPEATSEPEGER